jgi:amino acid transporter
MVGWSLLLAEWFSLAVFPVAFTQYFLYFMPVLDQQSRILLKAIFISIILITNILGVNYEKKIYAGIREQGNAIDIIILKIGFTTAYSYFTRDINVSLNSFC